MPGELMFALSVSLESIRPWEYWQMDSEEHHMICQLKAAWYEERDEERKALERDVATGQ